MNGPQNRWRRARPYRRRPAKNRDIPPVRCRALLTPGERAFFNVLQRSLPRGCALSLKTRLADVIECPDILWSAPFGRRVAQKHVDFVLYDPASARILAVIELDDKSHDSPVRQRRDRFLKDVLEQVGIPLVRVRCAHRYHVHILSAILLNVTSEPSNHSPIPAKATPRSS